MADMVWGMQFVWIAACSLPCGLWEGERWVLDTDSAVWTSAHWKKEGGVKEAETCSIWRKIGNFPDDQNNRQTDRQRVWFSKLSYLIDDNIPGFMRGGRREGKRRGGRERERRGIGRKVSIYNNNASEKEYEEPNRGQPTSSLTAITGGLLSSQPFSESPAATQVWATHTGKSGSPKTWGNCAHERTEALFPPPSNSQKSLGTRLVR